MLLFHYVDLYWLIMPEIPYDLASLTSYGEMAEKYADTPTNIGNPVNFLLAIGALAAVAAGTVAALSRAALVPLKDPRLGESLRFENM
jgi:hypothetical protein